MMHYLCMCNRTGAMHCIVKFIHSKYKTLFSAMQKNEYANDHRLHTAKKKCLLNSMTIKVHCNKH